MPDYGHRSSPHPGSPFRGTEGFTSDADIHPIFDPKTCKVVGAIGGWGLHLFGSTAGGAWRDITLHLVSKKQLSITPLKLLDSMASIQLFGTLGVIPERHRVVIRCKNMSAGRVGNTEAAYSPAMMFALEIFVGVGEEHNVTVLID